ncbi:hypothetical protein B0H11DRAFT_245531 [Mycena galericulata]|nr:hypothetical protein B0H11DRAFT_245531 [Mycena galericulata]
MSRSLPLEISSDIMLRCLPTPTMADPHPRDAPMIFLNICRAWSNIALATPPLWATMGIETAMSADYGRLIPLWVARAGTRQLTLSLRGSMDRDIVPLEVLFVRWGLWDRVQTLNIQFPSGDHLLTLQGPFPHLHALTISQFNNADDWEDETTYYSKTASECIGMLSAAPNLVEFSLSGIHFKDPFASFSRAVTHSNIKYLYLGGYRWDTDLEPSSACMLRYLTLPSLERLAISSFDIKFEDFVAFLARSAPPLRFLSMSMPCGYLNATDAPMERLFRLTPRITDLDLSPSTYWVGDVIASVLHAINSPLLPDLRNLTIHFPSSLHPPYEEVLGSLLGRRTYSPMQAFKLMWMEDSTVNWEPTPDVITGFRQLKEHGMQIYVGTPKRNLI